MTVPAHTCHAFRCSARTDPDRFMCLSHWRRLPKPLQKLIWRTYRPGQEISKDPSPEYMSAAMAAKNAVALFEGMARPFPSTGRCICCGEEMTPHTDGDTAPGEAPIHLRRYRQKMQHCPGSGKTTV